MKHLNVGYIVLDLVQSIFHSFDAMMSAKFAVQCMKRNVARFIFSRRIATFSLGTLKHSNSNETKDFKHSDPVILSSSFNPSAAPLLLFQLDSHIQKMVPVLQRRKIWVKYVESQSVQYVTRPSSYPHLIGQYHLS